MSRKKPESLSPFPEIPPTPFKKGGIGSERDFSTSEIPHEAVHEDFAKGLDKKPKEKPSQSTAGHEKELSPKEALDLLPDTCFWDNRGL